MFQWLMKLFGVEERDVVEATREPITHDMTALTWGNNLTIAEVRHNGHELHVMGWRFYVQAGDYLILKGDEGKTSRYRVRTIDYYRDPSDMFSAVLDFTPRKNVVPIDSKQSGC